ncbi:sigma factor [Dactylosporangium sp. AC04546]|uniref:sigma factor n=1 Tax=Dactylosporangium sp. AC04546 TaxID=2862460 RepID=UPI001EE0A3A8|nr:sigma factor [Dactylosporangium sp. AC04546]WVK83600.1 sigma factor [Dactylosporangium sp. AC04546]
MAGDSAEYVEYVTARLPALRRLAYSLTGDSHRADDLVQQTITTLFVRWSRIRQAEHLDRYVRSMLVNAFVDERRLGWARVRLFADEQVAWLYRDGTLTQLKGRDAQAQGINASGTIVGSRAGRPVRWPTAESEPVALPLPDGAQGGGAEAIDDDGAVVGYVNVDANRQAYTWSADGKGRPLPEFGEPDDSAAFTVRNGWATGLSGDTGVRWNLRTGLVEPVTGMRIRPSTANANGWMVGTDPQGRGVLTGNGTSVRLPDLFVHRSGEFSNLPTTLSDDGRVIAGQADDADGVIHAAAWRCR